MTQRSVQRITLPNGDIYEVITYTTRATTSPIGNRCDCPGSGSMAHVRGCPLHPEHRPTARTCSCGCGNPIGDA